MSRRVPALMAVLLAVAGCAAPVDAPYPASLRPCDLLSQQAAERILGVGKLAVPESKEGFFGDWAMNRYCSWTYDTDPTGADGAPEPLERSLSIDLVVYDAEQGGTGRARRAFRESEYDGQQPVSGIGDEAIWWFVGDPWYHGNLKLRRDNVVVVVKVFGRDCCNSAGYASELGEKPGRKLADQAAAEVDRTLRARR